MTAAEMIQMKASNPLFHITSGICSKPTVFHDAKEYILMLWVYFSTIKPSGGTHSQVLVSLLGVDWLEFISWIIHVLFRLTFWHFGQKNQNNHVNVDTCIN